MHRPPSAASAPNRRPLLAVLLLGLPVLLTSAAPSSDTPAGDRPAAAAGRVIVLGFDGADARTVRELLRDQPGRYPTFEKLAAEGTFEPLEVVAPPESPVSWAALNTGQNPAKTGVPGFIKRSLPVPVPGFGHIVQEKKPLADLDGLPIPGWSATKMASVLGGTAFLIGALLGFLLSRGRLAVALPIGFVLGGGGAYGGLVVRGWLPDEFPVTSNPSKAENFWDVTARNGVRTVGLDAAQAFGQPVPEGAQVLSGLGVPDARNSLGDWFIYTTDQDPDRSKYEGERTTTSGTVFRVDLRGGEIQSKVFGPKNFWEQERLEKELEEIKARLSSPSLSMEKTYALSSRQQELEPVVKDMGKPDKLEGRVALDLSVRVEQGSADVTIAGRTQTLAVGDWSDWYELDFALNPLLHVKAITRARLVSLEPFFELYLNVLDLDPREPPFWQPLSSPFDFSAELAQDCGLYETYGWPTMTMPFKDGEIEPELLMEDVEFTMKWREKLTRSVLERDDWQVFMSVFSTTDRVQHMMYQFYDELHPRYVAEDANRTMTFFGKEMALRDAVPSIYEQMDRIVGDVLAELRPEDTLIVCSDHGFQSFRRQFHVNNWLIENGYLAYNGKQKETSFLRFVDWKNTRVYGLGMGFLYLNLKGREQWGTVDPSEADALMAEVREKLIAATDQDTGATTCRDVYITKQIHEGPYLDLESDMLIGFAPPYRVSWSSTSGDLFLVKDDPGKKVPGPVYTDNDSPWSGDHISMYLPDVAGVFFCNKKVDVPAEGIRALQIAPTVLDLVGIAKTPEMDLGPLTIR